MNRQIKKVLLMLVIQPVFCNVTLAADDPQQSWQLTLLFNPGDQQYEMEHRGRIFIYDGLHDYEIERALDEQYDRIQGMMFVNTVVTDDDGVPLTDPETGQVLVENDGCD